MAAAIGGLILVGWIADVPTLRSWFPGQVQAKANTSIGIVLLGLALWVSVGFDAPGAGRKWFVRILALLVAAIASLTITEYALGRELGVDQFLVREATEAPYTIHAGRTPLPSATSLLCLSLTALILTAKRPARLLPALCSVVLVLAMLAFVGQLYGWPWLSSLGPFTPISMPSGVALFLLAVGFLLIGVPESTIWLEHRVRRAGILVSLGLLLLLAGAVVRNTAALLDSVDWVNHTQLVIERLTAAFSAMQEAEAARRGYEASRDAGLRRSQLAASAEVERLLNQLEQLTRDNPKQVDRVRQLRTSVLAEYARADGARFNLAAWREVIAALRAEEQSLLRERQRQLAAGTERTEATVALGLVVAVGVWLGVVFLLRREIARRQASEAALRRSEESLAVTLDSIGDAVLATDTQSRITRLNPIAERLTGWTLAEARGRPLAEIFRIVDEVTRQPAPNPVPHVLATGRAMELAQHTALIARDGTERSIDDSAAPIRDAHGRVLGVVLVFRDVTESRRAQAELDRFFTLSLDFLCISSADGFFKRVSPGVTDMLGWTVEEFLRQPYIELVHPDDRSATLREVERQMRDGVRVLNFENRYRHKDGSYRTISWRSVPERATGLMYATARDVTTSRAAEERIRALHAELQRHAAQLEAANKELEAFSYSVSHDLRAPLRHVQGYVEMLGRELGDGISDKARRFMKTIADAGREMGQLIDDLLGFSRMARSEMIETEVDLDALVGDVRRGLESSVGDRPIQWHVAPLPPVRGDPAMLRQVFVNLLGNAVKYSRGRTPAVIEVGTQPDGEDGRVTVFVRDNGAGFDMKYADKLFGVFQRLHRADEFEGTGIGLANVRRIVARHGGRTWAEGRPDAGATFYFTLNRGRSAAAPHAA